MTTISMAMRRKEIERGGQASYYKAQNLKIVNTST